MFCDGCDVERSGTVGRRRLLFLYLRCGVGSDRPKVLRDDHADEDKAGRAKNIINS